MEPKIRIKDIAKMAKVSVGTVDRVIHKRGEVAEESRKRVMDILSKTGYKPNLLARTLGSNKIFHVAAVLPNPSQDEYWDQALRGITRATEEWAQFGIQVSAFHFDLYDKKSFAKVTGSIFKKKPDGIITAPIFHQEALKFFEKCSEKQIPFVLVNNNIESSGALCFIGQDLYQSGQLGAELLHLHNSQSGAYAILHIYDDVHNSIHLYEKEKGFKDYFSQPETNECRVLSLDLNYTHKAKLQKELAALFATKDLKGILVTTSKGASIVSKFMEQRGKRAIRFVAYDMLAENLKYLQSGIIDFLINQDSGRQAFFGINQLSSHLLFKKQPSPKMLFPLEIISRKNLASYLSAQVH